MRSATDSKLLRKVRLLKRRGLFNPENQVTRVRRAVSSDDLEKAYRLVHDVFVDKHYIDRNPQGVRVRPFEALPEMATFIAEADGKVVAVMSVVMDSPEFGLPSDEGFKDEIDSLRRQGRLVCEYTNLAVLDEYRNSNAFPDLTAAVCAQGLEWGCDDVFIAISPCHAAFFGDVLRFVPYGDERPYSAEKNDIVQGMREDLRTLERRLIEADVMLGDEAFLHDFFFTNNSMYRNVRKWEPQARLALEDPCLLRRLFMELSSVLLDRLKPAQLKGLCRRWGAEVFAEVFRMDVATVRWFYTDADADELATEPAVLYGDAVATAPSRRLSHRECAVTQPLSVGDYSDASDTRAPSGMEVGELATAE